MAFQTPLHGAHGAHGAYGVANHANHDAENTEPAADAVFLKQLNVGADTQDTRQQVRAAQRQQLAIVFGAQPSFAGS